MQLAVQPLREGELLVVGERLVPEHEHSMLVHPGADRGERLGVVDLTEIHRADLGDEVRMQAAKPEGHVDVLLERACRCGLRAGGDRARRRDRTAAAPVRS